MKAEVTSYYSQGKILPISKVNKTVIGDLNLSNTLPGGFDYKAVVLGDSGLPLLPELNNVLCVCIAANGLRLRGIEIVNGRGMLQEWWCIPQNQ